MTERGEAVDDAHTAAPMRIARTVSSDADVFANRRVWLENMYLEILSPLAVGSMASLWTLVVFLFAAKNRIERAGNTVFPHILADDLFHAGALAATAVFMLGYFA